MVDVEKDHAVVGHLAAASAMFPQFLRFPALLAPVVNQPIFAAADILLVTPLVNAVHGAVGVLGCDQKPVDDLKDVTVPVGIAMADLFELGAEGSRRLVIVMLHCASLPGS